MPNSMNIQTVAELKDRLKDAKAIVLIDYKGISVEDVNNLRAKMREADIDYFVAKNTLVKLALNELGINALDDYLKQSTALAISKTDEVAPARELKKFKKESMKDKEFPTFKPAIINGNLYEVEEVNALADLPSRDELVAKVLSGLNSPITGFVFTLKGIIDRLVFVVQGISDSKSSS